jgi:hypothetical protein
MLQQEITVPLKQELSTAIFDGHRSADGEGDKPIFSLHELKTSPDIHIPKHLGVDECEPGLLDETLPQERLEI